MSQRDNVRGAAPQPGQSKRYNVPNPGNNSQNQIQPQILPEQITLEYSLFELMILYTPASTKFFCCITNLSHATGMIGIISLIGELISCYILQVVQHKVSPTYYDFFEEADYEHIPGNVAIVHELFPTAWTCNLPWFKWTAELLIMQVTRFLISTCLCFILAFSFIQFSLVKVYLFLNVIYYVYSIGVHIIMLIYITTAPGRVKYVVTWIAWYFVAFHFWCVVVTYYRYHIRASNQSLTSYISLRIM